MNFDQIEGECKFVAIRSRGPGGQNVNKVSSAVQLFWSFENSAGLSAEEKGLLRQKGANFINKENQIYLRSDQFRDRERNRAACLAKLFQLLAAAFHKPKHRKATKPTLSSKTKNRELKTRRSSTKKMREKIRV